MRSAGSSGTCPGGGNRRAAPIPGPAMWFRHDIRRMPWPGRRPPKCSIGAVRGVTRAVRRRRDEPVRSRCRRGRRRPAARGGPCAGRPTRSCTGRWPAAGGGRHRTVFPGLPGYDFCRWRDQGLYGALTAGLRGPCRGLEGRRRRPPLRSAGTSGSASPGPQAAPGAAACRSPASAKASPGTAPRRPGAPLAASLVTGPRNLGACRPTRGFL